VIPTRVLSACPPKAPSAFGSHDTHASFINLYTIYVYLYCSEAGMASADRCAVATLHSP
jgi:hypothetical protein